MDRYAMDKAGREDDDVTYKAATLHSFWKSMTPDETEAAASNDAKKPVDQEAVQTFPAQATLGGQTAKTAKLPHELTSLPTLASASVRTADEPKKAQPVRYEVLRPHAKGGLGIVSVAIDSELNREVALKEILPQYAGDYESRRRFTREAEVTGKLEHPGIVPVYGLGWHADGRPFYAMRFIRGTSFKDEIEKLHQHGGCENSMQLRILLNRFVDVCNAIAFAHSRGILHRDIKPANIMVGEYGETLVVDWGLAKSLEGHDSDSQEGAVRLMVSSGSIGDETRDGSALGTPVYMSPEQAAGKINELRPASDIYSLGATLYNLLTGQLPFTGRDLLPLLAHVQAGKFPRPRQHNRKIDKALEAICLKAMAKNPEDRYSTARELADDIERWMADEPVVAYREPMLRKLRRWAKRHQAVVALAVGLLVAALVTLTVSTALISQAHATAKAAQLEEAAARKAAEEEEEKARRVAEQNRQLLVKNQLADGFALLEKGDLLSSLVWFAEALKHDEGQPLRERAHRVRLATVLRDSPNLQLIHASHEGVRDACFSPDGKWVAVATGDGEAWIWDVETGEAVTPPLQHDSSVNSLSFSPDGKRLATASLDRTARIWDSSTGELVMEPLRHEGPVTKVRFSPDGRTLATGAHDQVVRIWDAAAGTLKGPLLKHVDRVDHIEFSPDSRLLAAISGTWDELLGAENGGDLIVWNLETMEENFPPIANAKVAYTHVEFSPDGQRIVASSLDGSAHLFDAETGEQKHILKHHSWVEFAAFSHDGTRVATASSDGTASVWSVETGEKVLRSLHHPGVVTQVRWSTDDRRLVTSCEDGTVSIWNSNTGVKIGFPMRHSNNAMMVRFSPDDQRLVTVGGSLHNQEARVWKPVHDSAIKPILPVLAENVAASADDDLHRIAVVTTSKEVVIRDRESHQSWTLPDAKNTERAWISADGQFVATVDGSRSLRLVQLVGVETNKIPLRGIEDVVSLVFDHASERIAVQTSANEVRIVSIRSGMIDGEPLKHERPITHMAFSPNDELLVVSTGDWTSPREGSQGGEAFLWRVADGSLAAPPLVHEGSIEHACFSPDGQKLVTSGICREAGETRIWRVQDGEEIASIRHRGLTDHACFSPDGKRIATPTGLLAYSAGATRIWDAETGKPLTPPLQHPGPVETLAFDATGDFIVTGCCVHAQQRVELRVWDAHTGQPVTAPVERSGRHIEMVRFDNANQAVLMGVDGNIWSLDLTPDDRPVDHIYASAQLMADQRIDESGSLWPLYTQDLLYTCRCLEGHTTFHVVGDVERVPHSHESAKADH